MNEKIKQLALDAGIGFVLWDDSGRPMIDNYTPEERLAKFAELIIQECYETCKENLVNDAEARAFGLTYNDAVGDCAIQIKNHFGVEE